MTCQDGLIFFKKEKTGLLALFEHKGSAQLSPGIYLITTSLIKLFFAHPHFDILVGRVRSTKTSLPFNCCHRIGSISVYAAKIEGLGAGKSSLIS